MSVDSQKDRLFVCVAVYEACSDEPNFLPLYEERFILVTAISHEAALTKANSLITTTIHKYQSVEGGDVTWKCKQVIDVAPLIDEEFVDGAEMYGRYFRDFTAYEHFEPRLKGKTVD